MTGSPKQEAKAKIISLLPTFAKKNPYSIRLIKFISNNPLYKGVFVLGSGTAVAQMIGIIAMPIITRLYTPSDLGILTVYTSLLAIVGIGATLRYEFALALPQSDDDAIHLFGLCIILLFISTAVFAFILFFGRDLIITTFDLGAIEQYLWFLLAGFFGIGLYTILNYWAIRERDYKRITYTKISQGAGGAACKIFLGIVSIGPIGLITGHIVSQIAGIGTLASAVWKEKREELKKVSLSGMKDVAITYRSFPIFNLPASIVNTMSLQLPPLILMTFYDATIVGFYALAYTVMVLPGSVVSQSLGQAYLGEASKMVRERSRDLHALYVRTLKHLSIIAVPLIGIPALCAPFVFPIFFGETWVAAGWYCWPLAVMMIAHFIGSPIGILSLYGYNHWAFIWNIIRVMGVIFSFYLSFLLELPVIMALTIYAGVMVGMYGIGIFLNLRAINNFTSKIAKEIYNNEK